jgi:hypothetical protein
MVMLPTCGCADKMMNMTLAKMTAMAARRRICRTRVRVCLTMMVRSRRTVMRGLREEEATRGKLLGRHLAVSV